MAVTLALLVALSAASTGGNDDRGDALLSPVQTLVVRRLEARAAAAAASATPAVLAAFDDREFQQMLQQALPPGTMTLDPTASAPELLRWFQAKVAGGGSSAATPAAAATKTDDGTVPVSSSVVSSAPAHACTLPHGTCCGNTTWSRFKWRAKASANAPFSVTGVAGGADHTAAQEVAAAAPPPTPQDLFTVCLSSKLLDSCTNATAAGTWSGWHEFSDNASRTLCKSYPNIMDPSTSLMLSVSVQGIPLGNMSTVTLDIQPAGARSDEPSYTLNATVTPIRQMGDAGTKFHPATRVLSPNFYLLLFAENHTTQPPVITGRENNLKYYDAMPNPSDGPAAAVAARPRRIRVLQEYRSRDNDIGAHLDAARALVQRLGASVLLAAGDTAAMQQIVAASGAPYISGRLTPPCNHTKCKSDHSFPNVTTEQDVDAMIDAWAVSWVDMMSRDGTNMSGLTQMEMYDEIG